ncbi:MAG: hypothetical protein AAF337_11880 [Pseudomonadota bacterium]
MIKAVIAWAVSSLVGYVLFAASSQTVVLNGLTAIGAPMPLGTRLASTAHAVLNMPALGAVIFIGFAVAFLVAKGIKTLIKPLAPIAYPVAGGAAVATALEIMWQQYEVYPVLGAQTTYGYVLAVLSGVIGGFVFARLVAKSVEQ